MQRGVLCESGISGKRDFRHPIFIPIMQPFFSDYTYKVQAWRLDRRLGAHFFSYPFLFLCIMLFFLLFELHIYGMGGHRHVDA